MFMILIILTLPFYISLAYAETNLTVTRYSGDADVNGFFDSYDRWVLEAVASIEGDSSITPEQVKINDYAVQDCSEIANDTFVCGYSSAYYSLQGGSYPSTVKLFSDDNQLLQSQNIEMTLDNLAPVIQFNRLPLQNESIVSVDYTLKDAAWKAEDFTKCSGPAKIEFWDNGVKLAEENITAYGCEYSGVSQIPLPSSGNLILKAFDKMGHISTVSSPEFDLDTEAPQIRADSLKMFTQGVEIEQYVPSGAVPVTCQIKIIEKKGLQAENVIANFSQFGGGSIQAMSCTKIGQEYTCTWPSVQLTLGTGTFNVKISAADDLGNKDSVTSIKSFTADTAGPNVISIGTRSAWNAISYVGPELIDIVATISESGAGLVGRQALMDLSEIDSSYSGKYYQANLCQKAGENWECIWGPVKSSSAHRARGNVYITKMYDDAGNEAAGVLQGSIFIDQKPPEVQELSTEEMMEVAGTDTRGKKYYAFIKPITAAQIPVISSGDDIRVNVRVKDDSEVKAYGDFSRIMGSFGYEEVPGICSTENNYDWNCTWEISSVASGYLNEEVTFTFTDAAGNNATVEQKVEVFAKDFETVPDYWTARPGTPMPISLDRSTTTLINHRMYFPITLKSTNSAGLVSTDLIECTGDTGPVDNIYIFNNEARSKDFFIGVWFKPFEPPETLLVINCTLNIQSTYRRQLVLNYEKEYVNLVVNFYEPAIGEAGEEITEDIVDEMDQWVDNGFWEVIGFLNNIFEWCNLICKAYFTYRQLVQVVDLLEDLFDKEVKATAAALPYAAAQHAQAQAKRAGSCYTTEATKEGVDKTAAFFDKFCAFINCKYSPLPPGEERSGLEGAASVLGGGGGIAAELNSFYSSGIMGPSFKSALGGFSGTEDYSRAGGTGGYMNVKENWVLSVLTICIPGIIYNLNKLRGIHCAYVNCLITAVEGGVSTSMCEDTKSYQECKYIWGPIFQLLPWVAFFDYIFKLLKNALSDPLALIGVALSLGCSAHCPTSRAGHKLCIFVKILSTLGDALTNLEQIFDPNVWELKSDPCIALDEKLKDSKIELYIKKKGNLEEK